MNQALISLSNSLSSRLGMKDSGKEIIETLKATAFRVKDGVATDAQLISLLIVAQQYSLNPFTKEIYAFPDKQNGIVPIVSVDGWARIINQHPQLDGIEFKYADEMITPANGKVCPEYIDCIIYRKDRQKPTVIREYLDEVYKDQYQGKGKDGRPYSISGPWQTHTKRFLRHKSLIQCARIAFGFAGIYDEDEAERIVGEKEVLGVSEVIKKPEKTPAPLLLEQISSMSLDGINNLINTMEPSLYSNDERPVIREAMISRRKELRDAQSKPVEQAVEMSIVDRLKACTSGDQLNKLLNELPESVELEYGDLIESLYETFA